LVPRGRWQCSHQPLTSALRTAPTPTK
jgi:hypothetical protein